MQPLNKSEMQARKILMSQMSNVGSLLPALREGIASLSLNTGLSKVWRLGWDNKDMEQSE